MTSRTVTKHSIPRRQFISTSLGAAASLAVSPTPAVSFADRANETDLARLSLKKAADLLRRKAVSPVELTQACLEAHRAVRNAALNAFITVAPEQALAAARELGMNNNVVPGEAPCTASRSR